MMKKKMMVMMMMMMTRKIKIRSPGKCFCSPRHRLYWWWDDRLWLFLLQHWTDTCIDFRHGCSALDILHWVAFYKMCWNFLCAALALRSTLIAWCKPTFWCNSQQCACFGLLFFCNTFDWFCLWKWILDFVFCISVEGGLERSLGRESY